MADHKETWQIELHQRSKQLEKESFWTPDYLKKSSYSLNNLLKYCYKGETKIHFFSSCRVSLWLVYVNLHTENVTHIHTKLHFLWSITLHCLHFYQNPTCLCVSSRRRLDLVEPPSHAGSSTLTQDSVRGSHMEVAVETTTTLKLRQNVRLSVEEEVSVTRIMFTFCLIY